MQEWIEHLWHEIDEAEWGTDHLIGAVDDLLDLADAGMIERKRLYETLDRRYERDLHQANVAAMKRGPQTVRIGLLPTWHLSDELPEAA
jgi:hypothetical protein